MARKYEDIKIGANYGRWTVIDIGTTQKSYCKNGRLRIKQNWIVECSCNNHTIKSVNGEILKNGSSKSCGCEKIEKARIIGKNSAKDITGERFGKLQAIEDSGEIKNGKHVWKCNCDCGKQNLLYPIDYLTSGKTNSCGCLIKNRLSGIKVGRLTVVNEDEKYTNINGYTTYKCICECGGVAYISASNLAAGTRKSCGCIGKEIEDLSGNKFGDLTVIKFLKKKYYNNSSVNIWQCKCSCGKIIEVNQGALKSGDSKSCGCLVESRGEQAVEKLLNSWGYEYKKQIRFNDCRYKNPLPFDFGIYKSKHLMCLIEYDGEQHFNNVKLSGVDILDQIKKRDLIKDKYCVLNKIPLIRIPYWVFYDGYLEYFLFDLLCKYNLIEKIN